jgi:hypothetical protein
VFHVKHPSSACPPRPRRLAPHTRSRSDPVERLTHEPARSAAPADHRSHARFASPSPPRSGRSGRPVGGAGAVAHWAGSIPHSCGGHRLRHPAVPSRGHPSGTPSAGPPRGRRFHRLAARSLGARQQFRRAVHGSLTSPADPSGSSAIRSYAQRPFGPPVCSLVGRRSSQSLVGQLVPSPVPPGSTIRHDRPASERVAWPGAGGMPGVVGCGFWRFYMAFAEFGCFTAVDGRYRDHAAVLLAGPARGSPPVIHMAVSGSAPPAASVAPSPGDTCAERCGCGIARIRVRAEGGANGPAGPRRSRC